MKIKKIMCGIITATMVFASVSFANTTNVEASLVDQFGIGSTIKVQGETESVEVTDEKKLVKISVEETGVYDVELSSSTCSPSYVLYSEEAKYIGSLTLEYDDVDVDFHSFYFVKGRNYYFRCVRYYVRNGEEDIFNSKFTVTKSDKNIDEEIKRTKVAMDAYYYVADGLPEGHNYYVNGEDINTKIEGVKWDRENNVLTFNNFNGPYVFEAYYGSSVFCDSADYDKKPVLTIEFNGVNKFDGMVINDSRNYRRKMFYVDGIDVNMTGNGTVNINSVNVVDKETSEVKETASLPFYFGNGKLCIDGPVINVAHVFEAGNFIDSSVVEFKSGELNVASLSPFNYGSKFYYPELIYARNLSIESGKFFIYADDFTESEELLEESSLFEGVNYLTVGDGTVIGLNADRNLYENDKIFAFACSCAETDDCYVAEGASIFVGKDVTEVMIDYYIDSMNKQKEDSNTQTENTKTDVNKSVNEKVDNKVVKSVYGPKKGTKLNDKYFTYKVTKSGTTDGKVLGEVEISSLKNKKAKKVVIKDTVTINGVKYKVTSIGKKAFAKCKKLKKVTIKAKGIKSIKKGAFKGVKKSCKIRVPKSKKKVYKKLLKKAKCKAKVK